MAKAPNGGYRSRKNGERAKQKLMMAERRKQAFDMLSRGATLPMIVAAGIGYSSPQHVHQDLNKYFKEVPLAGKDFYVRQQYELLSRVQGQNALEIGRTKLNKKTGERVQVTTPKQDMERTDRVVRISQRISKLLGLDAPSRIQVDGHVTSDLGKLIDAMAPSDWDYIIEHGGKLPPVYAKLLDQKTVDDDGSDQNDGSAEGGDQPDAAAGAGG